MTAPITNEMAMEPSQGGTTSILNQLPAQYGEIIREDEEPDQVQQEETCNHDVIIEKSKGGPSNDYPYRDSNKCGEEDLDYDECGKLSNVFHQSDGEPIHLDRPMG